MPRTARPSSARSSRRASSLVTARGPREDRLEAAAARLPQALRRCRRPERRRPRSATAGAAEARFRRHLECREERLGMAAAEWPPAKKRDRRRASGGIYNVGRKVSEWPRPRSATRFRWQGECREERLGMAEWPRPRSATARALPEAFRMSFPRTRERARRRRRRRRRRVLVAAKAAGRPLWVSGRGPFSLLGQVSQVYWDRWFTPASAALVPDGSVALAPDRRAPAPAARSRNGKPLLLLP